MNYRLANILADKSIAADGTEVVDINLTQPISAIVVNARLTNNGNTPAAHAVSAISKIEIVDGSDVLYSLSGKQAEAMDFYSTGKIRPRVLPYIYNTQLVIPFFLNFGRDLWDRELALDTRKFTNLQLRITHSAIAGGNVCDALELKADAFIFDERAVSPVGFSMQKQIKSYGLTNIPWEYTDLPTDYAYRLIMIASLYTQKNPHSQFREIKLSENVDQRVPFNGLTMDLIKQLITRFPMFREEIVGLATVSEQAFYITTSYSPRLSLSGDNQTAAHYFGQHSAEGGTALIVGDATAYFSANVEGFCPHGAVILPCYGQDTIDDMYDVTKIKSLQLQIKGGTSVGSSSTAEICIQQIRKY